jgi:hypothetical protein
MRPDGKRGDGLFASLRSLRAANGDRRDLIAKCSTAASIACPRAGLRAAWRGVAPVLLANSIHASTAVLLAAAEAPGKMAGI